MSEVHLRSFKQKHDDLLRELDDKHDTHVRELEDKKTARDRLVVDLDVCMKQYLDSAEKLKKTLKSYLKANEKDEDYLPLHQAVLAMAHAFRNTFIQPPETPPQD